MNPNNNEEKEIQIDNLDIDTTPKDNKVSTEKNLSYDTLDIETDNKPNTNVEMQTKPRKEKHPGQAGRIIRRVFNLIIWLAILAVIGVWATDYIMVQQEKKPKFCIKEKTHQFNDGTVDECVGLGYKVYKYNRSSYNATEFGPFFIEMKDN